MFEAVRFELNEQVVAENADERRELDLETETKIAELRICATIWKLFYQY